MLNIIFTQITETSCFEGYQAFDVSPCTFWGTAISLLCYIESFVTWGHSFYHPRIILMDLCGAQLVLEVLWRKLQNSTEDINWINWI